MTAKWRNAETDPPEKSGAYFVIFARKLHRASWYDASKGIWTDFLGNEEAPLLRMTKTWMWLDGVPEIPEREDI